MPEQLDSEIEQKVRNSFSNQSMMTSIGAQLESVDYGQVMISAPILEGFRQQQDLAHGGLVFSIADTAAGYAALSVMPADMEVLTAEVKINLLAPGTGRLTAQGRVLKPGKRLVVVAADVYSQADDGRQTHIAALQGTMMPVRL